MENHGRSGTVSPIQSYGPRTRRCISALSIDRCADTEETDPLIPKDTKDGMGVSYSMVENGDVTMAIKSERSGAGLRTFRRR
jgi:hypothetical protein